ncbi:hypothetical protein V6N13_143709 [Hibiscus sabdariffa]
MSEAQDPSFIVKKEIQESQDEELDELRACVERIGGVVLFWQSVGSISTISYANTFGVSGENIRRVGY